MTREKEVFIESAITQAVCKLATAKEACLNVCMSTSQTEPMQEKDLDQLFGVAYIIEDIIKQLDEAREMV